VNAPVNARTFKSGNSEGVRLPKGLEYDVDQRSSASQRHILLNELATTLDVDMFVEADIDAYCTCGRPWIDRRRTLDRLIAAQALARHATLACAMARISEKLSG
jgi:predicted exporter